MLSSVKIYIDQDKCIGCGRCVSECLGYNLSVQDKKAQVLSDNCLKCGHCFAVCPQNAVRMEGTGDDVLARSEATPTLDATSLKNHLKLRRSIRQYQQTPVEKEKLEAIIEAGRLTPTGSNSQNVRYIVVQNGIDELEDAVIDQYKELQRQAEASGMSGASLGAIDISRFKLDRGFLFYNAPALILVVSENSTNACLAAMSMELMAEALGLGTLYVGLFTRPANQNPALRESLGIAPKEDIVICLTVGYPAVQFQRSAPKLPAKVDWR
ncbi:MAG: nitroreductase family protein [Coriobacteriales bacterium]|jgi:nitroreductase/NAD-dependent dihydropyrimidine dehydrogenase PreA subunit|nr:nitroreductase family protein [Coriobacteriales bacterium]